MSFFLILVSGLYRSPVVKDYTVRLVSQSESGTRPARQLFPTAVSDSVSEGSRMDYAVHQVESPTRFNIMAMIMEAKYHTTNIRNAVDQVCVFCPFVSITVRLLKFFVHHYRPLATLLPLQFR